MQWDLQWSKAAGIIRHDDVSSSLPFQPGGGGGGGGIIIIIFEESGRERERENREKWLRESE